MNVNFGLFPPITGPGRGGRKRKADRKAMMAERAGEALKAWMADAA
jgi:methylenetetrahydrofolate--tRNA-(uracil-5-)-methyltransferase